MAVTPNALDKAISSAIAATGDSGKQVTKDEALYIVRQAIAAGIPSEQIDAAFANLKTAELYPEAKAPALPVSVSQGGKPIRSHVEQGQTAVLNSSISNGEKNLSVQLLVTSKSPDRSKPVEENPTMSASVTYGNYDHAFREVLFRNMLTKLYNVPSDQMDSLIARLPDQRAAFMAGVSPIEFPLTVK